jgi:hypothetical protein
MDLFRRKFRAAKQWLIVHVGNLLCLMAGHAGSPSKFKPIPGFFGILGFYRNMDGVIGLLPVSRLAPAASKPYLSFSDYPSANGSNTSSCMVVSSRARLIAEFSAVSTAVAFCTASISGKSRSVANPNTDRNCCVVT